MKFTRTRQWKPDPIPHQAKLVSPIIVIISFVMVSVVGLAIWLASVVWIRNHLASILASVLAMTVTAWILFLVAPNRDDDVT